MAVSKKTYINFLGNPEPTVNVTLASAGTCIAATGNTVLNQWHFNNGASLEHYQELACAQIVPIRVAEGLQVPNDNTDEEGGELIVSNSHLSGSGLGFTIGTDAAFMFELKLQIPDIDEMSVCAMGFRKQGAITAGVNSAADVGLIYDDIACFNVDDGDIKTVTELNNSGSPTTTDLGDTDWVNDATKTLTVKVSSAGVVTYFIDGTAATDTAAYTFDTGDIVIPFFSYCKDATAGADDPPVLVHWFSGYQ